MALIAESGAFEAFNSPFDADIQAAIQQISAQKSFTEAEVSQVVNYWDSYDSYDYRSPVLQSIHENPHLKQLVFDELFRRIKHLPDEDKKISLLTDRVMPLIQMGEPSGNVQERLHQLLSSEENPEIRLLTIAALARTHSSHNLPVYIQTIRGESNLETLENISVGLDNLPVDSRTEQAAIELIEKLKPHFSKNNLGNEESRRIRGIIRTLVEMSQKYPKIADHLHQSIFHENTQDDFLYAYADQFRDSGSSGDRFFRKILKTNSSAKVKKYAAQALGSKKRKYPGNMNVLKLSLYDPNEEVQQAAVRALAEMGDTSVFTSVERKFNDPKTSETIKSEILDTISQYGHVASPFLDDLFQLKPGLNKWEKESILKDISAITSKIRPEDKHYKALLAKKLPLIKGGTDENFLSHVEEVIALGSPALEKTMPHLFPRLLKVATTNYKLRKKTLHLFEEVQAKTQEADEFKKAKDVLLPQLLEMAQIPSREGNWYMPDGEIKNEVALSFLHALGKNASSAMPSILAILNDKQKSNDVRKLALDTLFKNDPNSGAFIASLVEMALHEDSYNDDMPENAREALSKYETLPQQEKEKILMALQKKGDDYRHAIKLAGHLPSLSQETIPILRDIMYGHDTYDSSQIATEALTKLVQNDQVFARKVTQSILDKIQSENVTRDELEKSFDFFDQLGPLSYDALPFLRNFLMGGDPPYLRNRAARALGRLGRYGARAFDDLLNAIDDPNARVGSIQALTWIHRGDSFKVIEKIIPYLNSKNRSERVSALIAFEELHPDLTTEQAKTIEAKLLEAQIEPPPTNVCESICKIASEVHEWKPGRHVRAARFAEQSLGAYFMVKAAPFCPFANEYKNRLISDIPVEQIPQGCDSSPSDFQALYKLHNAFVRINESLQEQQEDPEAVYGKLYSIQYFRELLKNSNLSEEARKKIMGLLEKTELSLKNTINKAPHLTAGRWGSFLNTYALSTAMLPLNRQDIDHDMWDYFDNAYSRHNPTHVSYDPTIRPTRFEEEQYVYSKEEDKIIRTPSQGTRIGFGGTETFGSTPRAVPYWLAHYKMNQDLMNTTNDPDESLKSNILTARENLIQSLDSYAIYGPVFAGHMDRLGFEGTAHSGPQGLAPYFYMSTVPYATAAIQVLMKSASEEEKGKLVKIKKRIQAVLLAHLHEEVNQEIRLRGPDVHSLQSGGMAGPRYNNWYLPMAGLALISLGEECSSADDAPKDATLGILNPDDFSIASPNNKRSR